ncbi:aminoglycoside phosphotransferase family protein [Seohaeicola zhoushanensis]|uniref:Aminoglycoside phosphotransferase n=1 Tax=Seohaeicola zhoushanensis TaxID=1569283 RepID=A0A8J3GTI0_9RHOB|nr:phosphotransferase [Seohaeicola zhoushanensis]GHF35265.1 aminoglycoside phosphotransferase [Seohaeicola zhoushanensis]
MTDRKTLADAFLSTTVMAGANRGPLAGDASNRRYERLRDGTGRTAVLMDAPPEKGEDVRPFVRIARHLHGLGLSAPEILAEDPTNGFLLIEDLGDDLYSRVIPRDPSVEAELYRAATEVLVVLADAPMPALAPYGPERMTEMACLAFSKYRDPVVGQDATAQSEFAARFREIMERTTGGKPVLAQRDYHADNLLWLPEREGAARVGLLDFQDAMAGHPAYDLVSLLQDVRRDVSPEVEAEMLAHYIARTGADETAFRTAYMVLGAQRNLRILGVFGRLGLDYGKPHYVDMIPKVWAHVMRDLDHSALEPVADLLRASLPAPTPEVLAKLKRA